ncbi:dethiobiotin synthetase [Sporosarcina newyorkensis 2681]|uniref:ATP-dependent dethiobiotin synthetase BioD n=1 Tax=Sporosarcina newyorkensis 2681 TaxID=1027292 RepID=F9DWJ0_9BACL|nr:dethiobiotin synthase [Sporosarcina newyorkensis]EGQ21811.1 dethiobiotin synthetase [Sporosarcina newyorkensis 2681]
MAVLFVTGTDTDVGKTIATTLLISYFTEQGLHFTPFKPVQTGAIQQDEKWIAPDVMVYQSAANNQLGRGNVEYLFQKPCSPHLAASIEDREIQPARLSEAVDRLGRTAEGLVIEGAGGLYVPLTGDGYCMIDWMEELKAPVVIVARAGVGTINHSVLTINALKSRQIPIAGVLLNDLQQDEKDIIHDNGEMISKLTGIPVIGVIPHMKNVDDTLRDPSKRIECYQNWDMNRLQEALSNECGSIIGKK